jgi:hypothetical protein
LRPNPGDAGQVHLFKGYRGYILNLKLDRGVETITGNKPGSCGLSGGRFDEEK